MITNKLFLLKFFIFTFFFATCNSLEPPPEEKPTLNLKLENVSCMEAWIKLTTTNLQLPTTLTLKQSATGGDQTISTINLDKADTLLYIDSLLPNANYTFQASSIQHQVSSNVLSVTTMDTTSHNFTWQTFTFGEHSSSVLRDVAIIDENNIWTVGEIYLNDSLGQPDPNAYNAVHWDGTNWALKRIPFTGTCSAVIYPPIRSIFAFSNVDLWFARGGSLVHFDGSEYFNDCGMNSLLTGSINKIWGKSTDDLYIVGNNGNIAHYNGSRWNKLYSGTELHIYDIWGQQTNNGGYEILCIASNLFINQGKKVLQVLGTNVKHVNDEGLPWSVNTIWFIPGRKYFIGGDGLYYAKYLGEDWVRDDSMPPYYKGGIRGNEINDIIIVGAFGLLLHYNGFTWINFQNISYINGSYGRVDTKDNLVVCTGGLNDGQAIVTIGRR